MKTSVITSLILLLLPFFLSAEQDKEISLDEIQTRDNQRFAKLDSNDDGHISLKEYEAYESPMVDRHKKLRGKQRARYRRVAARDSVSTGKRKGTNDSARTKAHHKELFSILDEDQNLSLTQKEFLAAALPKNHRLAQKRASFKFFDSNKDGKLSRNELPSRVKRLATFDSDKDGFISKKEMPNQTTRKQ